MLKRFWVLITLIGFLLCSGCQKEVEPPSETRLNPTFANMPDMYTDIASVVMMNDVAIFTFTTSGLDSATTTLISYNLSSDTVLGELTFENDYICVYPNEDQTFALFSHSNKSIEIYDTACEELSMTQLLQDELGIEAIAYQPNHLLYRNVSDGTIEMINLETKEIHPTTLSSKDYYNFLGTKNDEFILYSGRQELVCIDMNGASEFIRSAYVAQVLSDTLAAGAYGEYNLFYPLSSDEPFMVPGNPDGELFLGATETGILSTTFSELLYYDLVQNQVIQLPLDNMFYNASLRGNYVITISQSDESTPLSYHFLDLTEYQGKPLERIPFDFYLLRGIEPLPDPTGSAETVALIQQIEKSYGIRILYEDYFFSDVDISHSFQLVDEATAYQRLLELETVLDFFPEGIFFEMNEQFPVVLYFCQDIIPAAGGLNTLIYDYNVSFVDATYQNGAFLSVVAHELAHAMEHRIDWNELSAWSALMPEEAISAYGTTDSFSYTPYDDGRTPVWFVSEYGKTNVLEDRATIFESMFSAYLNNETFFVKHNGIQLKMECWSNMLRNTYRCCEETTFSWDSLIQ